MKVLLIVAVLCIPVSWAFGKDLPLSRLTTNVLERTSEVLEKAANDKDLNTVLAHLASNVVISVSFPKNPNIPPLVFSKDTYTKHLEETWTRTPNALILRLKTEHTIAENGKSGTTTSTFRQTVTVKNAGQTLTSNGKQVCSMKLINGIPKATRIDVTISYALDSNK
jgi:hypothetical protein